MCSIATVLGGTDVVAPPSSADGIMSLHDVVHLLEQPPKIDEISSPINARIFEFCDPDLFSETLHNSEAASSSNCCYEENSLYTANLSFSSDVDEKFSSEPIDINMLQSYPNDNANTTSMTTTTSSSTTTVTTVTIANTNTIAANNSNLSIIFDSQEDIDNDISASIDFSPSPSFSATSYLTSVQPDQLDFSTQVPVAVGGFSQCTADPVMPLIAPSLPPVFEEDGVSATSSFLHLNPTATSFSFFDPSMGSFFPGNMNAPLAPEASGMFTGVLVGQELQPKELDCQGDHAGIFCPDQLPRLYNPADIQALSNENQQMVSGPANSTPSATEISSLEDSTLKVGKLSVEQRKEKIHRYLKKRNERNFSKKIKYACRKTLADSRPRVRGRFARNDDSGETHRHNGGHNEAEDYDEVPVKEEEELVDNSDIFAQISGATINSFNCGYPIQSWI
ncbi:hypothetical protein Ancab_013050 [Ancistrocladus abbreviatus]